jgi:hypothetical protein
LVGWSPCKQTTEDYFALDIREVKRHMTRTFRTVPTHCNPDLQSELDYLRIGTVIGLAHEFDSYADSYQGEHR